jgi:DAACS family dicarboxylate/amino acid:cation (Na+ or H+) symporter
MPDKPLPPDSFERELTTDLKDETPDQPRGLPLHTRILIGLIAGAVAGVAVNATLGPEHPAVAWALSHVTEPIGTLFLRLLLMVVIPLIFSALVVGVAGIGDARRLGRVGIKTLAFTLIFSAISATIGLTLANIIKPWDRVSPETAAMLNERYGLEAEKRVEQVTAARPRSPVIELLNMLVPSNPIASVAGERPNLLHLIFFAAVVGIAATLLPRAAAAPFLGVMQSLFEISAKIVDLIMKTAPYAVAALLFNTTATFGLELLAALLWFVVTVLLGLALHFLGVFSLAVRFLSGISPLEFFRRSKTAILTAFSTSSSNATLPTTLRVAEQNLGVPREISGFVLTVGATVNMNGTTLYEGLTVLFLAQLAGGVEISIIFQVTLVYLAVMGAIGAAGVPGGSIPLIIGILVQLGINPALIAIVLGIDRLLDMARTTVNVTGDLVAATYIARSEGYELLKPRPR